MSDSINLTAPNGQTIASNIDELKSKASNLVENGINSDITITTVKYFPVKVGSLAEIRYVTSDGYESNFVQSTFPSTNKSGNVSPNVQQRAY